jgi:2-oxoglutarate ferredoxin oxidoreductase subunit alpha
VANTGTAARISGVAKPVTQRRSVVVRFCGDSGDGMQLAGAQLTQTSALAGNDIATFPDFPAEIRAPRGSLAGVSGFQIQFAADEVLTPGDAVDALVAMNPAALKENLHRLKPGETLIVDDDAFDARGLRQAGYAGNPLEDGTLASWHADQGGGRPDRTWPQAVRAEPQLLRAGAGLLAVWP